MYGMWLGYTESWPLWFFASRLRKLGKHSTNTTALNFIVYYQGDDGKVWIRRQGRTPARPESTRRRTCCAGASQRTYTRNGCPIEVIYKLLGHATTLNDGHPHAGFRRAWWRAKMRLTRARKTKRAGGRASRASILSIDINPWPPGKAKAC